MRVRRPALVDGIAADFSRTFGQSQYIRALHVSGPDQLGENS
jgi:hypothetical protein